MILKMGKTEKKTEKKGKGKREKEKDLLSDIKTFF